MSDLSEGLSRLNINNSTDPDHEYIEKRSEANESREKANRAKQLVGGLSGPQFSSFFDKI